MFNDLGHDLAHAVLELQLHQRLVDLLLMTMLSSLSRCRWPVEGAS
jgi:hypothetical protein